MLRIKPLSERLALAQRKSANLLHHPFESFGVHVYLQAGFLFTLLLWNENSTSNGDRAILLAMSVQQAEHSRANDGCCSVCRLKLSDGIFDVKIHRVFRNCQDI